jgi:thiaminase
MIAFESDKVMFEIYRDPTYSGSYRVVYFTELNDHNRETEFNEALRGEHFYDGFIANYCKDEAKRIIGELLERLNRGDALSPKELSQALREFMP